MSKAHGERWKPKPRWFAFPSGPTPARQRSQNPALPALLRAAAPGAPRTHAALRSDPQREKESPIPARHLLCLYSQLLIFPRQTFLRT